VRRALQQPPKGGRNTAERRSAIRRILRGRAVGTQEELARLLGLEGFEVTQATLSRDLTQLRARRASSPEGAAYELEPTLGLVGDQRLREVSEMVVSIAENGNLVVLLTQPGAASTVARAIDLARLPEILGSLAGDDTIFVAPSRSTSSRALARRFRQLLGSH
jgi:transcriptional regulator of arginine metabolism